MTWYRHAFGAAYRWLYAYRDEAEAAQAVALLERLAPLGSGPLLDLGCGEGRHLESLAAPGRRVIGLDLSPDMLAAAARRLAREQAAGRSAALVRADMRELPVRGGACTAVLSLFTAFGYFGSLQEHAGLLAEVARVLRPGGHWFLDYLNCDGVTRELAAVGDGPTRLREAGPLLIQERRRLASCPARVIKQVSLRALPGRERAAEEAGVGAAGLEYTEEVALFGLDELDALAGAQGLRRRAAAGGYDGRPLAAVDAERWVLVYRRQEAAS